MILSEWEIYQLERSGGPFERALSRQSEKVRLDLFVPSGAAS